MAEPIFMKLSTYITAPEPISTACFINSSCQSVCVYVYLSLDKHPLSLLGNGSAKEKVAAATNTHATIEELLDSALSMLFVSYKGK
jgi:hypothetical protein